MCTPQGNPHCRLETGMIIGKPSIASGLVDSVYVNTLNEVLCIWKGVPCYCKHVGKAHFHLPS